MLDIDDATLDRLEGVEEDDAFAVRWADRRSGEGLPGVRLTARRDDLGGPKRTVPWTPR